MENLLESSFIPKSFAEKGEEEKNHNIQEGKTEVDNLLASMSVFLFTSVLSII